jgi:ELMO domain-containing protein
MRVWRGFRPSVELSGRRTKQWQEIGFQGDSPATDFRGMGVLGLVQLVALAESERDNALAVLSLANHPAYGFPLAITGINVTALLLAKLERVDDAMLAHFGDLEALDDIDVRADDDDAFGGLAPLHALYVGVMSHFARFYVQARPDDIMSFPPLFKLYQDEMLDEFIVSRAYNQTLVDIKSSV